MYCTPKTKTYGTYKYMVIHIYIYINKTSYHNSIPKQLILWVRDLHQTCKSKTGNRNGLTWRSKINLRTPLGWNIGRPLAQEFLSLHVACLNAQNFVVLLTKEKTHTYQLLSKVTLFRPKNVTSSGLWSVFHVGNQSSLKNPRYLKLTPRTCQVAASLFMETIFTSSGVRGSSDPVFHRLGYTGKI